MRNTSNRIIYQFWNKRWIIDSLRQGTQAVVEWSKWFQIPPSRIMAGEFGVDRQVEGAKNFKFGKDFAGKMLKV